MTLSYNVGLTGGSLIAYVLDAMLGPPLAAPCRPPPRFVTPRTLLTNLTSSTQATTLMTAAAVTVTTVLTTSPTTPTTLTTLAAISLGNFTTLSTNLTAH